MSLKVDLLKLRHPRVGKARQTKLYLSQAAFDRLHSASRLTGLDMSAIVDTLIQEALDDSDFGPGADAAQPAKLADQRPVHDAVRAKEKAKRKQDAGDFDLG